MQAHANWEHQLLDLAGHIPHPSIRPFFSYWAGDASLRSAYKQAEVITAEHSKSFHFASGLLPEEKRSAVRALYAFCRTVDDIVDEVELKKDRDFELDYWRNIVQTASSSDRRPGRCRMGRYPHPIPYPAPLRPAIDRWRGPRPFPNPLPNF
jgi:hypothetical protein